MHTLNNRVERCNVTGHRLYRKHLKNNNGRIFPSDFQLFFRSKLILDNCQNPPTRLQLVNHLYAWCLGQVYYKTFFYCGWSSKVYRAYYQNPFKTGHSQLRASLLLTMLSKHHAPLQCSQSFHIYVWFNGQRSIVLTFLGLSSFYQTIACRHVLKQLSFLFRKLCLEGKGFHQLCTVKKCLHAAAVFEKSLNSCWWSWFCIFQEFKTQYDLLPVRFYSSSRVENKNVESPKT